MDEIRIDMPKLKRSIKDDEFDIKSAQQSLRNKQNLLEAVEREDADAIRRNWYKEFFIIDGSDDNG